MTNTFNRETIAPSFTKCNRSPSSRQEVADKLAAALAACTIRATVVPGFTQPKPRPLRSNKVDPETRLVRKHYGIPAGIARDLERDRAEQVQIKQMADQLEAEA